MKAVARPSLPLCSVAGKVGKTSYCFCQNHSQSSSVAWQLARRPYFRLLWHLRSL